jgi:hypothetical protein
MDTKSKELFFKYSSLGIELEDTTNTSEKNHKE